MASSGLDPRLWSLELRWTLLIHEKKVKHSNRIIGLTILLFCAISYMIFFLFRVSRFLSAVCFLRTFCFMCGNCACSFIFFLLLAWIYFSVSRAASAVPGMLSQSIVYVFVRVSVAHKSKISRMTARLIYILSGFFFASSIPHLSFVRDGEKWCHFFSISLKNLKFNHKHHWCLTFNHPRHNGF